MPFTGKDTALTHKNLRLIFMSVKYENINFYLPFGPCISLLRASLVPLRDHDEVDHDVGEDDSDDQDVAEDDGDDHDEVIIIIIIIMMMMTCC